MSNDTVDDLHAAEDACSGLAGALEELLDLTMSEAANAALLPALEDDATRDRYLASRRHARAWVERWFNYCRPTCGAEGDPDSDECTDETCGCPCYHRQGGE